MKTSNILRPRCSSHHPERLYDCTENHKERTRSPTTLDSAKQKPHRWFIGETRPFYSPFFIRVVNIYPLVMEFRFLHSTGGYDLFPETPNRTINYRDPKEAWAALPSTAYDVTQGSPNDCGLLFISDDYIQNKISQADYETIHDAGGGDGKWPFSAGELKEAVSRLRKNLPALAEQDQQDLEDIFGYIESEYA